MAWLQRLIGRNRYLDEDSRYAKRRNYNRKTVQLKVSSAGGNTNVVNVDWDDRDKGGGGGGFDDDDENGERLYAEYSPGTRRSMSLVDEERINYELIVDLITLIAEDESELGAVLVFLPGLREIQTLVEELNRSPIAADVDRCRLLLAVLLVPAPLLLPVLHLAPHGQHAIPLLVVHPMLLLLRRRQAVRHLEAPRAAGEVLVGGQAETTRTPPPFAADLGLEHGQGDARSLLYFCEGLAVLLCTGDLLFRRHRGSQLGDRAGQILHGQVA